MSKEFWIVVEDQLHQVWHNGIHLGDFATDELAEEYITFKENKEAMKRIINRTFNGDDEVDKRYARDCAIAQEKSDFNRRGF
jgi:hypothetical protein